MSDNAADIVLSLKDFLRKQHNTIVTDWDQPSGRGKMVVGNFDWTAPIYDMGESITNRDFHKLITEQSLTNYNLPYDPVTLVFRTQEDVLWKVIVHCTVISLDDENQICCWIYYGFTRDKTDCWIAMGYRPYIVENTTGGLSIGFLSCVHPSIDMDYNTFIKLKIADRALFSVYYLLWLNNGKNRVTVSPSAPGKATMRHNRKTSSRRNPIGPIKIIKPGPVTVTALSRRPIADSPGWTQTPHTRSGHYRTYKNGRKIWIESYNVHGGTTTPRVYQAPEP